MNHKLYPHFLQMFFLGADVMRLISKIAIILFLMSPIIRYYEIPGTNIELLSLVGIVNLLIFLLIVIQRNSNISKSISIFILFFVWGIITTLISLISHEFVTLDSAKINNYIFTIINFLSLFFMIIIISFYKDAYKQYRKISIILICALFLQVLLFYGFSYALDLKIPGLKLINHYEVAFKNLEIRLAYGTEPRFTSFFSEPAHFVQYITPFLIVELFVMKTRNLKNLIPSFLISLSILLTLSGNGIVILLFIWSIYIILLLFTEKKPIIVFFIVTIVILLAVLSIIYFDSYLDISSLFINSDGDPTKADYRIYRGFYIFVNLPFWNQLFGTGYRNATNFIAFYNISTPFDNPGENIEYMNAITQVMVYFGLVGFFTYIILLFKLFNKQSIVSKILVLVLLLLSFSSSLFSDSMFFIYVFMIFYFQSKINTYSNNCEVIK